MNLLTLGIIKVNFASALAYSQISLCVGDYVAHDDVLIPLAVVLSGLEAERCEDQFAGVPLAHGRVAEHGAYIHVLVLAAKFLQNDAALAHLASLGLLACHLLGLTLFDNFED